MLESAGEGLLDITRENLTGTYDEETNTVYIGSLPCNFWDAFCRDPRTGGIYTWNRSPPRTCQDKLKEVYRGEADLYSYPAAGQAGFQSRPDVVVAHNSTRGQIIGLVLGHGREMCNRTVHSTQFANTFVAIGREALDKVVAFEPEHMDIRFSVLNAAHHFVLLDEANRQEIMKHVITDMCENSESSLRTTITSLRNANKEVPHIDSLGSEGVMFRVAGATCYIMKCPEVTVAYRPTPFCSEQVPVTYKGTNLET